MTNLDLIQRVRLGVATPEQMKAAPSVVFQAKSEAVLHYRAAPAATPMLGDAKAVIDVDARTIRYAGSVEIVDRMADTVVQAGLDTTNFLHTGGVFLWNHDHGAPIGQALSVFRGDARVPKVKGRQPATLFDIGYLGQDLSPAAEVVFRMAAGLGTPSGKPLLKGTSIGFVPQSVRQYSEEELEKLKIPGVFYGGVIERSELLELSQAPVPANQGAVTADKGIAASVDAALTHMVDTGAIKASLATLFREQHALSPLEEAKAVRSRVANFHDVGSWEWPQLPGKSLGDEPEGETEEPEEVAAQEEVPAESQIGDEAPAEETAPEDLTAAEEEPEQPEGEPEAEKASSVTVKGDLVLVTPELEETLKLYSVQLHRTAELVDQTLDEIAEGRRACSKAQERQTEEPITRPASEPTGDGAAFRAIVREELKALFGLGGDRTFDLEAAKSALGPLFES